MKENTIQILEKTAWKLRRNVLEMIGPERRGHFGGSLSAAELVTVLYFHKMRHDPRNPGWENRDRFVLSKGHSAPILYAALGESGYFNKEHFRTFKEIGSILQGHPDMLKTPGVEANTGSLGQGLSIGVGMALGMRMDRNPAKVYVMMGDGEMGEGQIWEAGTVAAHYQLDNLVGILDHNKIQAMGFTRERINTGSLMDKWKAFGWEVIESEGHSIPEIIEALDQADHVKGKPVMIIAHTIKGKGISFTENTAAFHNNMMTRQQYDQAMNELNAIINS